VAARNSALTLTFPSDREIVLPRLFDTSRRRLPDAATGNGHLRRRCGACAERVKYDPQSHANDASRQRRSDYISIALGMLNGFVIATVWAAVWLVF
jgi:hypothetical protein